MEISIKRIYEKSSKSDGVRVLVDRLWPRGISKSDARIDLWLKEIAPSPKLREFFHSDKEKNYDVFIKNYKKELLSNKAIIKGELAKINEKITLVTAVKDIEKSHLPTLITFLNKYRKD